MEQGIEDFNQMLDDHRGLDGQTLNEDKKSDYRDLRRRGKNRVAARDSREKKITKSKHLKQKKATLERINARQKGFFTKEIPKLKAMKAKLLQTYYSKNINPSTNYFASSESKNDPR